MHAAVNALVCVIEIPKGSRNKWYKDLDAGRHSEVKGWGGRDSALKTIQKAREQFLLSAVRG
jgi:inorganic pyrophosphatase